LTERGPWQALENARPTHAFRKGTATPSRQTNTLETPTSAHASGCDARAERGNGIEGANSAGTTTGSQSGRDDEVTTHGSLPRDQQPDRSGA
jgi:hypothetical protein